MGKLPPIEVPEKIPLEIPVAEYLADHRFEAQAVFPAVESMEILARAVADHRPGFRINTLETARFDKFLPLPSDGRLISATAEITISAEGDPEAALITRTRVPKAAITRAKTHARMRFSQASLEMPHLPTDAIAAPEGICYRVSADAVYRELVPFGPCFRNLQGELLLSPDGALGRIACPDISTLGTPILLGSPFALDAAFHAACVWGQRFAGVVGFPTALAERAVLIPTEPGETYFARVFPKQVSRELLLFDLYVTDPSGRVREAARGVEMRDPSGGRLTPPDWIMAEAVDRANDPENDPENPLRHLRKRCETLTVVELEAPAPFAPEIFSPLERTRFEAMGPRRKKSFLAARLALKQLYRRWEKTPSAVPAPEIETVSPDDPRPRCRVSGKPSPPYVSVSHDARFAVAVCNDAPVGVDVETISERCLRAGRIFMSEGEGALCRTADMGAASAAVRIWSAKEAVSKAMDVPLAEAWHRVQVTAVDLNESRLEIEGRSAPPALHAEVSGHLFTLFSP